MKSPPLLLPVRCWRVSSAGERAVYSTMKLIPECLSHLIVFRHSVVLMLVLLAGGCSAPKQSGDFLASWRLDRSGKPDPAIERDYNQYMYALPLQQRIASKPGQFLEDGNGGHAVVIEVAVNGTWYYHVLIYDNTNRRIKVIKYSPGRYRS